MRDSLDKNTNEMFLDELEKACAERAGLLYYGPDKRLRGPIQNNSVCIMLLNDDMDNFKTLGYENVVPKILEEENVIGYDGYETVMWGIGSNNTDPGRHYSGQMLLVKYKKDNPNGPWYNEYLKESNNDSI